MSAKEDWLRKWMALKNGIPSHDCIARVISRIKPTEMTDCFISWVNGVAEITEGEVIAIDGKTARRSYNRKNNLGAIHMVSAWAN
jgi:DDE_Tnp_1-associated